MAFEKERRDIVVNAGGETRKVAVKFFFQLVRQKREREIHTAVLVSTPAVDLLLKCIGQQHLVPFGIERKCFSLLREMAVRECLSKFIKIGAVADSVENVR